MDVMIRQYTNEDQGAIKELIFDNQFVREDIVGCLEAFPQYGLVATSKEGILGVGVFTGGEKTSSMTLYVKPSSRRRGIGSLLLKNIENSMINVGVEEIVCDFIANELEQDFMKKHGYQHWFKSNYMTYSGSKLPVMYYDIRHYEDEDYDVCQKIFSEAFHKMRLSVGLPSTLSLASENEKNDYKENAENMFVLRDEGQIVAAARVDNHEIDSVAVDVEQQGKGYGKALVCFLVNQLRDRGAQEITLWAVEGNSAKFLYEQLGFKVERLHEFVIKKVK